MNIRKPSQLLLWFASVMAVTLVAAAGRAAGLDREIFACRQVEEPGRRLSCYDQIGRENSKAPGDAVGASAPTQVERDTLRQKVVAVSRAPDGKLVITLDNAQTWRQVDTERADIRPGDSVTIQPGALGSWLLVGERGRNAIRVHWQR